MLPGHRMDALETAMPPVADHETWFHGLYHQRAGEVGRYLRRRGADADDVDDLVSAVFLDAWRQREDLLTREPACQRAWLYETATNHLRNHWRSRERTARFLPRCPLPQDDPDVADVLADAAEATERRGRFARALAGLSSADQQVVTASLDEESATTLGRRLGVSEAGARQRLCRARRRLAAALALAGAAASAWWAALEQTYPWVAALAA